MISVYTMPYIMSHIFSRSLVVGMYVCVRVCGVMSVSFSLPLDRYSLSFLSLLLVCIYMCVFAIVRLCVCLCVLCHHGGAVIHAVQSRRDRSHFTTLSNRIHSPDVPDVTC